ncbi:hypothetical protein HUV48_04405 [Altererythrobacter sp. HHU K3-1]|uniref:FAD-binding monooxygenase n=2 Tax=Qipengyuania atrilutea TaxID=2744473 RepID=A0A850H2Y1_9SPHN|nr:hypothetical protein [Actirhodobacter atriluteus]
MAAITLGRAGVRATVIDRQAEAGDALCGGFLSWRSAKRLRDAGIDLARIGAHPVHRLALFAGDRSATAPLPETAFGLSRRALDTAMRERAAVLGARFAVDTVRSIAVGTVQGERHDYRTDAIFLATGKHDVRGLSRPRIAEDPALGLRIRIAPSSELRRLLEGRIELHLFDRGYAGIVMQEGGSANICLAVRKSLLAEAGGSPWELLQMLGSENEAFANRLSFASGCEKVDTIGAVPYGWIAAKTEPGLYRLGDQGAVIPSLAGEGMGIAMQSGEMAARCWVAHGSGGAAEFQKALRERAQRPVRAARLIWQIGEHRRRGGLLVRAAAFAPMLARLAMQASRI